MSSVISSSFWRTQPDPCHRLNQRMDTHLQFFCIYSRRERSKDLLDEKNTLISSFCYVCGVDYLFRKYRASRFSLEGQSRSFGPLTARIGIRQEEYRPYRCIFCLDGRFFGGFYI